LPRAYRRRYNNSNIKSELSSLSGSEDEQQEKDGDDNDDAKKVEQIIIDTSGRSSTVKEELLSCKKVTTKFHRKILRNENDPFEVYT